MVLTADRVLDLLGGRPGEDHTDLVNRYARCNLRFTGFDLHL